MTYKCSHIGLKLFAAGLAMIILYTFTPSTGRAQDMHFSQFFASPLYINPANAGNFKGKYRAGLNFRNQWSSFTTPWRTFDFYGDYRINEGYKRHRLLFGAGTLIMRDRAGDGNLSTTKAIIQGATHLQLGGSEDHTISMGIGLGLIQKTIDWDKLYFNNQWDESKFNTNLATYENYSFRSITYPDINIGVLYQNASLKKINYSLHIAVHHLLNPHESFYKEFNKNNLGCRPLGMFTLSYQASDQLYIVPGIFYETQKNASELQFGGMVGYDMSAFTSEKMFLYLGMYNRTKDAWYPIIGLEYGAWRGFINYDINYSELKQATNGRGAFELSIVYIGGKPRYKSLIDIPCPRF